MMKRERERESICKYKREERKQFQSVAYIFLSQLFCFKADEFALIFFRERICSHKQQKKKTTPILTEQSLFAS